LTAAEVKALLGLQPHPREGGWYVRTWESPEHLPAVCFSGRRYDAPRRTSTAIYYLLEPATFSEMHRLASDEIFHHYMGDAVEMLELLADGTSRVTLIGTSLSAGERPQHVVQRGIWQGSRLAAGGTEGFALLGCTVSPGFEFDDYRDASADELIAKWPGEAERIRTLTNR
jgi:predicted cupin superfamily sugar epimerase